MAKQRLDVLLVARGLFPSREKAQRAIMAGDVTLPERIADKPGLQVAEDAVLTVRTTEKYVGRGGLKLEEALAAFSVDCAGAVCLDVGASTGGFTDCLLQHGAAKVYAIDVGHSQLAWKIRDDPRVEVREHLNARYLTTEHVPEQVELCVLDVSFISLTLVLPVAMALVRPGGRLIPLIKPQFELRREDVGKGGVVRDPALRERAVERIRAWVLAEGSCAWDGCVASPITGAAGNQEYLACLRRL